MGDTQSAHGEERQDAAAEEESGGADDAPAEHIAQDKPLKISAINGKADTALAEINGHCEDKITAEAILSTDIDSSETGQQLKEEETQNVGPLEKESPLEADAEESVMIEMDAKQNDINESFRRFFSNIGLKLTVKRGSTDVSDETKEKESNRTEDIKDAVKVNEGQNAEQGTDLNAERTYDNRSTTQQVTVETAEKKTTETQEDLESDIANTETTVPEAEDEKTQQDVALQDPNSTSTSSPEAEDAVSPVKRFFTTGIFSGLRKKKKPIEDEKTEEETMVMGKETHQSTEKNTVPEDKEIHPVAVEATKDVIEHKENEPKEENLCTASAQVEDNRNPPSTNTATTENEPGIISSQDKAQDSPLKRLLSGSSFKKLSKKQKGRRSSNAKLSDSEEHFSEQLTTPATSPETRSEESPTQHSTEAAGEEDGAWASFKKLLTPKRNIKRSSLTNDETQSPGTAEETKPSEGGQISDDSTEESKKRKDSSVSWEAVLCGSGRRRSRSRKTSDSDDEKQQVETGNKEQVLPHESSNEVDNVSVSPKQAGSPESDGGSTWKSFKKLVNPKKKAKDEEESKQSDSEVTQDESSFSIQKFLTGRKNKSVQDQVSSDEADKEVDSDDEDSETPAVVPLSEFDTSENGIHITTHADVESHVPKKADYELQEDLLDQLAEPTLPSDTLQTEAQKIQDNTDTLNDKASTAPTEEPEDLTESVSKYQPLSDIPEEGIITETMGTPASPTEEVARDDTIAEDLIEITSEAITAPEPVDITLADETEMISAVSQLSESSNTSGNTTPIPVEYDIQYTDMILHQAVETISINQNAVPVCSDDVRPERIVGSVSHQIFETFVKEEPTIVEIHRPSDTTCIGTGLSAEELDSVDELAATSQTESLAEFYEAVSTELASVVSTEEFVIAEMAVDKLHEVNVSHPEECKNNLESADKSVHVVENQSEACGTVSTETLPDIEVTVVEKSSPAGVQPDKNEPTDSEEAQTAAKVSEENKDVCVRQEIETPSQVQVENKDQPSKEMGDFQESRAVQDATIHSEEKEVILEDVPAGETLADKPKEEPELLTELNADAVIENNAEADTVQTEHTEEPDASESSQTATLEDRVQQTEKEIISDDIPVEETFADRPEGETDLLTEHNVEAETANKLQVDDAQTEDGRELDVLESVQTVTSNDDGDQLLEKEIISETIPTGEAAADKPGEETELLIELNADAEMENKLETDCVQTKHAEEPGVIESVQTATLEEIGVQLLEKEVISADIQAEDIFADKPKEETDPLSPCNDEAGTENIRQANDAKTEPEVCDATLDLEEGPVQFSSHGEISEDIPAVETVTDGRDQATENLTEDSVTPEKTELKTDPDVDHHQVADVLEDMQLPATDNICQSHEGESQSILEAETVTDEPKEETGPPIDASEHVEAFQSDHVPEPNEFEASHVDEVDVQPCEKEVISEDVQPAKTVELPKANEDNAFSQLLVEDAQTPEVLPSDDTENATKTETEVEACITAPFVRDRAEESSAEKVEEQILCESKVSKREADVLVDLNQDLETNEDQETEITPQNVLLLQEGHFTEEADELQAFAAVHVSSVHDELRCVQFTEKYIFSEETQVPSAENASTTHEPMHEKHVSAVQCSVEDEKCGPPGFEIGRAAAEHATFTQVITCCLKDVAAATHAALTEVSTDTNEPLTDTLARETKSVTQLVQHYVTEKGEDGGVIKMLNVPLVQFPDNHQIQVQVVDVDINSAEKTFDKELEVVITEVKEVSEACHETVKEVDNLFATSETQEKFIHEENKATAQEVIQHVKDDPPEMISESVLEQDVIKQTDGMTEKSERDSDEVMDQQVMEGNIVANSERQHEAPVVITGDIPASLAVLIHDKENSEEPEDHATTEEVTPTTDVKNFIEEAQILQIVQTQTDTQNTGMISSGGNAESPSSLSFQFKFNIQIGQSKEPLSAVPTTDRTEPVTKTSVSEVSIQAVEPREPIIRQCTERQQHTELTEVAAEKTEITETELTNLDSTDRPVITSQSALLDVGMQTVEIVEPVQQIASTERGTCNVQLAETVQTVRQREKRQVFLSQPVLSDEWEQEEAEEPVKHTEEENDQDVWMDAEEDIFNQEKTEMSLHEVEEPQGHQTGSGQEEKAVLEPEFEMAPSSGTEREESQDETLKKGGTCETEGEGEEFAVAFEDLRTTTDWD